MSLQARILTGSSRVRDDILIVQIDLVFEAPTLARIGSLPPAGFGRAVELRRQLHVAVCGHPGHPAARLRVIVPVWDSIGPLLRVLTSSSADVNMDRKGELGRAFS